MNLAALAAIGGVLLGFIVGWGTAYLYIHHSDRQSYSQSDIQAYMARVVNMEAVEHRRKMLRLNLLRAGRRTVRHDGGPPAKVMRMRKRRKGYRARSANN